MAEADLDVDAWRERVLAYRERKDDYLASDPDAPLDGSAFDGLDYYEPDPDYRLVARYEPRQRPEAVELAMTTGPAAEFQAVATFGFELSGAFTTLTGFRADGQDTLLVPFTDATTGDTTPETGRYLDVDVSAVDARDDVALDCNLAYAPFAHYDAAYASPVPPADNRVDARVEAGERRYE